MENIYVIRKGRITEKEKNSEKIEMEFKDRLEAIRYMEATNNKHNLTDADRDYLLNVLETSYQAVANDSNTVDWYSDPQGGNDLNRAIDAYADLEKNERYFSVVASAAKKAGVKIPKEFKDVLEHINTGNNDRDRILHINSMKKEIERVKELKDKDTPGKQSHNDRIKEFIAAKRNTPVSQVKEIDEGRER